MKVISQDKLRSAGGSSQFSRTRGFIVAGASSGSGKTTITSAICKLMAERGLVVQPFKTGPDFVDPTYLTLASGRECGNLDGFPAPELMPFFYRDGCMPRDGMPAADIAVIEGVMGLYDGMGTDGLYSTAWLARTLDLPVILILDARSSATSAAATAHGFATLRELAPRVVGVIANRVSNAGHAELVADSVARFTGLPLLGWMPAVPERSFPSRHLGLVPALERSENVRTMENFTKALSQNLDLDKIISLSNLPSGKFSTPDIPSPVARRSGEPVRVAIADDDAFCFQYRENRDLMKRLGAEIAPVSPIQDRAVPEGTDLLILPGGYPEEFMDALSDNTEFLNSLRTFSKTGRIYAECGGMLYLSRSMEYGGSTGDMAGIVDADVKMTGKLHRFGYVEATALRDNLLMRRGEGVRAHEFHYSKLEGAEPDAFSVRRAARPDDKWTDGYVLNNARVLATYLHINFYSCPASARRMLALSISESDAET
jgi:cobyrinic acid a,c-diamide synthase